MKRPRQSIGRPARLERLPELQGAPADVESQNCDPSGGARWGFGNPQVRIPDLSAPGLATCWPCLQ
jgi:hypothetical protein